MTQIDLIDSVVAYTDLPKSDISKVVEAVFDAIQNQLASGERVSILGFGTFSLSERKERQGRNPQTGETTTIPASKDVRFKVGKQLKDAVND